MKMNSEFETLVKIINSETSVKLEREINNWIRCHPDYEIKNISISSGYRLLYACILYLEQ